MRKPTHKSRKLSKKLCREGNSGRKASRSPRARQAAEGLGLRRGPFWPHQLAHNALLSEGLSETYPDHHLLVVLDGAPSHRSEEIVCPQNVDFLRLPAYSPELDPVERWFQEFRRELSNKAFQSVELLQEALDQALWPYW